ncbi:uncharacterized protein [Antedon mediterranea]|uniref:uncharacterized protein n=1 Tax=Antedon mediterranea TaxID=105859 RepID=UPI003AF85855
MSTLPKKHHERSKIAVDRPKYREGNRDRAVKVFTINKESVYLLIQGVPDVKITRELLELCSLYGTIDEYRILDDYPTEQFTKVYWIKYQQLQAARVAKRKLDDQSFYGGVLHVCYAPEYETVSDTRLKLQERRKTIARRTRQIQLEDAHTSNDGHQNDEQILSTSKSQPSGLIQDEKEVSKRNEISSDSQIYTKDKQTYDSFPPALPDPPKQLPFEKWKRSKYDGDQPPLPSAHSTLPPQFNPYPAGYRHPGPPQSRWPRLRKKTQYTDDYYRPSGQFKEHLQEEARHPKLSKEVNLIKSCLNLEQYRDYCPSQRPRHREQFDFRHHKPPRQFQNSMHTVASISDSQHVNTKKNQDGIKFVPPSVTRKRTSSQANLNTTPNECEKRVYEGQMTSPSKPGITLYRQGNNSVEYEQPPGPKQISTESCSFRRTVESIRSKMKMVSKVPHLPEASTVPPAISSTERIRI